MYEVSFFLKTSDTTNLTDSFVLETANFAEVVAVTYAEIARVVGRPDLSLLPAFDSRFAIVTPTDYVGTVGFRRIGMTSRMPASGLAEL